MIKLIGTKLKSGNYLDYIWFYLRSFLNCYSKLFGWIMEERKCAAAGSDADFPYGNSLIGNCNPWGREVLCIEP